MPEGSYDPSRSLLVTAAEARSFTGFTADRDLSTADFEFLIRRAQAATIRELARQADGLALDGPVDGSNAVFQVPPKDAARVIVDDTLNLTTDASDVLVQLRDDDTDPPTFSTATVSSVDALNGLVTLAAAPATDKAVLFWGRLAYRRIDREDLKTCILYLTAWLGAARVQAPGSVNLANPNAQRKDVDKADRAHLFETWQREVSRLRGQRALLAKVDVTHRGGAFVEDLERLAP